MAQKETDQQIPNVGPVPFSIPGENPDDGQNLPDSDSQSPRLASKNSLEGRGLVPPRQFLELSRRIPMSRGEKAGNILHDKIRLCHCLFCLAQRQ